MGPGHHVAKSSSKRVCWLLGESVSSAELVFHSAGSVQIKSGSFNWVRVCPTWHLESVEKSSTYFNLPTKPIFCLYWILLIRIFSFNYLLAHLLVFSLQYFQFINLETQTLWNSKLNPYSQMKEELEQLVLPHR